MTEKMALGQASLPHRAGPAGPEEDGPAAASEFLDEEGQQKRGADEAKAGREVAAGRAVIASTASRSVGQSLGFRPARRRLPGSPRVLRMGSLPIAVNFVDIEESPFFAAQAHCRSARSFQVDHQSRISAATIFASSPGVALWRLPQGVEIRSDPPHRWPPRHRPERGRHAKGDI